MVQDSKGRIQSTVVCGRKFCSICGKWRHLLYFPPRRHRNGREYANSPCEGCKSRTKERRGEWGAHRLAHRREYDRIYKEARRREGGVQPRNFSDRKTPSVGRAGYLDPVRLYRYLSQFIRVDEAVINGTLVEQTRLNGTIVTDQDMDFLRHVRNDQHGGNVGLDRADRLCVDYHLELWELEEAAQLATPG